MSDYLFSLKGFLDKDKLKEINSANLHFKEVPFCVKVNFPFNDIHQVEAIIKCNDKKKTPIYSGNIFSFSGILKITFLLSEEESSQSKIISTTEAFTFSVPINDPFEITEIDAFDINFITISNTIKGSLSLLLFNGEKVGISGKREVNLSSLDSIDTLFL
ncbi:MAG: hypothetical protein ACRC28_17435 [Clostridium sp.]|uniref:hypothetical protein n=1 Tax=Clostridium sp. TaxID=1506 RepID=UPI003F2CB5DA